MEALAVAVRRLPTARDEDGGMHRGRRRTGADYAWMAATAVAAACEGQGAASHGRGRPCGGVPLWLAALGHVGQEVSADICVRAVGAEV